MDWRSITVVQMGMSLVDLVVIFFLAVVGANLGSFLNVVAHRVPLGMSVVFGGSRCPACGQAIRSRDNLPVLGWLLLRGRCRDCLVPIPVRYPFVEAVAGVLIGAVASVELLSGGLTLPLGNGVTQDRWWRGVDDLLFHPNGRLVGMCLLHGAGLVTLLAWALLEHDRQRLPVRWGGVTFGLLLGVAAAFPWLQPVPAWPTAHAMLPLPAWQVAGLGCLIGILAGWLLGGLFAAVRAAGPFVGQGLALVGGLCGWQAVVTVSLLGLVVMLSRCGVQRLFPRRPATYADWRCRLLLADLVVALTLQLLSWRWLDQGMTALLGRLSAGTGG